MWEKSAVRLTAKKKTLLSCHTYSGVEEINYTFKAYLTFLIYYENESH
jgi:hypothetical protein